MDADTLDDDINELMETCARRLDIIISKEITIDNLRRSFHSELYTLLDLVRSEASHATIESAIWKALESSYKENNQ